MVLDMARQPAEEARARMLEPVGGRRLVLREGRCPFNDGFPKEVFVLLLKKNLPSSMWETSIVSQEIPWWNPNSCSNLAFFARREIW